MAENYLQQAKGSNARKIIGFEAAYNTAAPANSGFSLKFNPGDGVKASRDLNNSETIQPGRSATEPFQGNGSVEGSETLPLDVNQIYLLLKAAFGAPTTTAPSDLSNLTSVADANDGKVTFTLGSGHGITAGDFFAITGTTNYNGEYKAISATATTVVAKAAYVAETFTGAKVTKTGWIHQFTIPSVQPSFTYEQVHEDIAEHFVYTGCKISTMGFAASADGQETTLNCGIMGSKPAASVAPAKITAVADASGSAKVTLNSVPTGLAVNSYVVVAGTAHIDGRHKVTAVSGSMVTLDVAYASETITTGYEPVLTLCHFGALKSVPVKRLGTFSATVYKDGNVYPCAKNLGIEIDMGLDGEQRVIGDNGYRSELPEGTVSVTTSLTALFKSGQLFREASENATVAIKLVYASGEGIGGLEINVPENKIQQSAPAVDTASGLSQDVTLIAFSSDSENGGSSITIKLTNAYASL